ncbi:MAG: response regulator [Ferruginibacter sp.]
MGVIVLIVDDDDSVRFFHRVIVTRSKLSSRPISFGSGEKALDYLDQNCSENDLYLILLDINMPGMNGWDLVDAIGGKTYHNQVYIVMVTSSVDREDHEKAKSYDMIIDVIEKPISDEECKKIMNSSLITQYL